MLIRMPNIIIMLIIIYFDVNSSLAYMDSYLKHPHSYYNALPLPDSVTNTMPSSIVIVI